MFGSFDFSAPVNRTSVVMVDLPTSFTASAAMKPAKQEPEVQAQVAQETPVAKNPLPAQAAQVAAVAQSPLPAKETDGGAASASSEQPRALPEPEAFQNQEKRADSTTAGDTGTIAGLPDASIGPVLVASSGPPLRESDFLAAKHEKLSYLISMHGIPIGSAELEANNEKGSTTITLRVKSNAAISNFFPVDDVIETRLIDGMFIMTTIRQQEGSFRSDEMFTINLGKKRVSWVDFVQNRSLKMTVPTDQVLDTLSGIYYLRNRHLQVGRTETLHIYDSETYAEVPVDILRREEMRLPNLAKIATLVVRPLQKTAGIFRRTGDILIWMTDDDRRVPVKIVTSVALGTVTAELVSAETTLPDAEKARPVVPVLSSLAGPNNHLHD